jgi:hypothetical protein
LKKCIVQLRLTLKHGLGFNGEFEREDLALKVNLVLFGDPLDRTGSARLTRRMD